MDKEESGCCSVSRFYRYFVGHGREFVRGGNEVIRRKTYVIGIEATFGHHHHHVLFPFLSRLIIVVLGHSLKSSAKSASRAPSLVVEDGL